MATLSLLWHFLFLPSPSGLSIDTSCALVLAGAFYMCLLLRLPPASAGDYFVVHLQLDLQHRDSFTCDQAYFKRIFFVSLFDIAGEGEQLPCPRRERCRPPWEIGAPSKPCEAYGESCANILSHLLVAEAPPGAMDGGKGDPTRISCCDPSLRVCV